MTALIYYGTGIIEFICIISCLLGMLICEGEYRVTWLLVIAFIATMGNSIQAGINY